MLNLKKNNKLFFILKKNIKLIIFVLILFPVLISLFFLYNPYNNKKEKFESKEIIEIEKYNDYEIEKTIEEKSYLIWSQNRKRNISKLTPTGFYFKENDKLFIKHYTNEQGNYYKPKIEIFNPFNKKNYVLEITKKEIWWLWWQRKSDFYGILYIVNELSNQNKYWHKIKIKNGRPMPHFINNFHDIEDWKKMIYFYSDSPYVCLSSEKNIVTITFNSAKKFIKNPIALLNLLDEIVKIIGEQYGIKAKEKFPHIESKKKIHHIEGDFDYFSENPNTKGYTTGNFIFYDRETIPFLLNEKKLKKNGYVIWHEIGHNFQMKFMEWNWELKDITVDLSTLYVNEKLNNENFYKFFNSEQGKRYCEFNRKEVTNYLNSNEKKFNNSTLKKCEKLLMFWQLHLIFGKNFYADLGKYYRNNINEFEKNNNSLNFDLKEELNYNAEKEQIFIKLASKISKYNLNPFFNKWGVYADKNTIKIISNLKKLENNCCLENNTIPLWEYDLNIN